MTLTVLREKLPVSSVNLTSKILLLHTYIKNWNYLVIKSITEYYTCKTKHCFIQLWKGSKSESNF